MDKYDSNKIITILKRQRRDTELFSYIIFGLILVFGTATLIYQIITNEIGTKDIIIFAVLLVVILIVLLVQIWLHRNYYATIEDIDWSKVPALEEGVVTSIKRRGRSGAYFIVVNGNRYQLANYGGSTLDKGNEVVVVSNVLKDDVYTGAESPYCVAMNVSDIK